MSQNRFLFHKADEKNEKGKNLKLISWNINSIRTRIPLLKILVEKENPDIIVLQETKVPDNLFPQEFILEELGYNSVFTGEKSYNGVAILSKSPIEDVSHFECSGLKDHTESRYIEAFTAGHRVASVYIPNGRDVEDPHYLYKGKFFEALKENITNHIKNGEKMICAGDYNVAPTERDTWDEKHWHGKVSCTDLERKWFADFCKIGMVDIMDKAVQAKLSEQKHVDSKNDFTWWSYRQNAAGNNKGLRLDQIMLSENVVNEVIEARVCRYMRIDKDLIGDYKTSDHAPILCVIRD